VREGPEVPKGNPELVKLGAVVLPEAELSEIDHLPSWLHDHANPKTRQPDLFDSAG